MRTCRKFPAILLFTQLIAANLFGQDSTSSQSNSIIGINSELSYLLLDQNQNLRKTILLLENRQKDQLRNKSLIIGTSLLAILDYQKASHDSKFGYLMRHPTSSNQIRKEVSEAVIHSFQLSVTGAINNWLTVHSELLYNPEQSFGAGTITALGRNQIQLRKGMVVFGDLDKFPVYGAIGKMDAPFGQTGSVSPFTNSTMWHAFGGLAYGAQVGFKKWGLHGTFMAVQGGAQFRALNTPVGDSTAVPSKINNFVADLNYDIRVSAKTKMSLGGSYMHGSAYCHDFPVTHFDACGYINPAYTYYGKISFDERLILKGGFAKTLKVWKGTFNPTPPLDIFPASKVSSLDYGAQFNFKFNETVKYTVSAEFSNFIAGAEGAPWERQNQIIVGFAGLINKSAKLFVEYFHTDGYVPLNFISGSAPFEPFPPGVTHSLRDTQSNGIVVGAQITF